MQRGIIWIEKCEYCSTFCEVVPRVGPSDRMDEIRLCQHRHLRQREYCLGSAVKIPFVRDTGRLIHTRARSCLPYWSNQSWLMRVTKPSFLKCARNFMSSFCHIFADLLPVFAQTVFIELCRLILGKMRQVSHTHHVDYVIQKWFGCS